MNTEIRKSLKCLLWNGSFAAASDVISAGTILIAYVTFLGAGNFYIGLILSLPFFSNLMNFFVSCLLEKGVSCKKISIISSILSKPMYLIAALLPFWVDKNNILTYMFGCILLIYVFGNITSGSFSVWVKRLVPEKILGAFFARRYSFMMFTRLICYTGIYVLLKNIKQANSDDLLINTYSAMFFVAFCLGILTIITFFLMKDIVVHYEGSKFFKNLKIGFKNKDFCRVSLFVSVLSFLTYSFFPFVTVFMLKSLNYSMDSVVILTIFFQLAYIFSANIWGFLNDEVNMKRPLKLSLMIIILCVLGFLALSWHHVDNRVLLFAEIFALHLLLGAANSSIQLSLNNIPLICIPDFEANTLVPTINAIKSFFAGIGSVLAGIYITTCSIWEKQLNIANKDGWFIFFLSILFVCLYLVFSVKHLKKCEMLEK